MSSPEPTASIVIEAGRSERHYWKDLWRYRELLGFLAWRDIKVRYKQAVLGAAWALIQPVITTAIFTIVFGRLAGMPDGGIPYPLLVLSGLIAWQLFSTALSGSSGSLVSNANLVSKIYFPRLIVPLSAIGVAVVDFAIVLGLFTVMAISFGYYPTWHWLLLPVFIAFALLTALGAGMWLTALTVKYRDFRFITPFLIQIGLFVSPVGFRTDFYPSWQPLLSLNPMTGIINGFRWCLLQGNQSINFAGLTQGVLVILLLNVLGLWYFRRTERGFADII
ncbi:ABC transporter permease [Actomonas aquatica]|uniref:Transport permease protein n=1 Tax=Actomonas aquatica TaxID=2866162 RepID=A0ABZ1C9T6_9BACT|nr:ABC transporter permease [Opitutus sp. WL0086]WRQ88453.1 ABC transporter permease [Opitutus sp. WL0086]